jgi:hypothetical protein
VLLADPVEALQPVHLGHAQVEESEIRVRLRDEREHLAAYPRLGYDFELVVFFERTLDSGENERMVVCDQNAHGRSVVNPSVGLAKPSVRGIN